MLTQSKYNQNPGTTKILSLLSITADSLHLLNDHLAEIRDWRQILVILLMYVIRPQSMLEDIVKTLTESTLF